MGSLGTTGKDAAGGAAAGAVFGPYGAAAGAILGGLYGAFSNDGSSAVSAAAAAKQAADRKAAADYLAQRDIDNRAHMQTAADQLGQYHTSLAMLNAMNGGQGAPTGPATLTSPVTGPGIAPVSIANPNANIQPGQPQPAANGPTQLTYVPQRR